MSILTTPVRRQTLLTESPQKQTSSYNNIVVVESRFKKSKNTSQIHPSDQLDTILENPANQTIKQNQDRGGRIIKRRETDFQAKDEFLDGFVAKKRPDRLRTMIRKGVKSAINVPGQALQFLIDGGAKQDKNLQNDQHQKNLTFQAKLSDEQYKHDHGLLFRLNWILFYTENVLMPIIILSGTVLCLVSLFLWQQYDSGVADLSYYRLLYLDIIIGGFFSLEWLYNMQTSQDNYIVSFFQIENLLDSSLVVFIVWRFYGMIQYPCFVFFLVIRSLRILKLRHVVKLASQNFKRFVLNIKTNDLQASDGSQYDDDGELNKFIIDSIVKLCSGIIIESTYFLSFDEYMNFTGFNPYNSDPEKPKMNFIEAVYYTIVSFSTIGYGDIYPVLWVYYFCDLHKQTRLSTSLILLVNITVMSNFLGKFIEFLIQWSPYDRTYDFTDHIVIIGHISADQLKDFLDELVENDRVENQLLELNESTGIKTIIVLDDEPNDTMRYMANYYTEQFGNEVRFLKEAIYSAGSKWQRKSNLSDAKILFAFSWFDKNGNAYENDKLISLAVTSVRDANPNLRIMLILHTNFKDQLDKDSLYKGIQSICPNQLNQYIMAQSLENPGIGTVLQHLLNLKTKTISQKMLKSCQHDHFMLSYIANMQQEIYSTKIHEFLVGMSFKECALMLYLYGLEFTKNEIMEGKFIQDHIQHDRKMTLMAVETSVPSSDEVNITLNQNSTFIQDKSSVRNGNSDDDQHSSLIQKIRCKFNHHEILPVEVKSQILINPQNYILQKGDVLYVICEHLQVATEVNEFHSEQSPKYIQYAINKLSLSKTEKQKQQQDDQIRDMFTVMKHEQNTYNQSQCDACKRDLDENDANNFQDAFDFNEQQYPPVSLENHFIIFGRIDGFVNVLQILRKYTDRPAILYTEDAIELFKWKELRELHKNIFFIKGEYLNLDDLQRLELKSAYQILIMSELMIGTALPDAIGVCIARILIDLYDRNDFIIQLNDESTISFLNKNPRLKDIECPKFFYPSFASGTIHFSSMITSILAKIVYSPNWLRFFEDLTIPKNLPGKNTPNKTVNCLRISQEAVEQFKFYGQLHVALLEHSPSIIGIGMVKETFGSKFHEQLIDHFMTDSFINDLQQVYQDIDLSVQGDSSPDDISNMSTQEKANTVKDIKIQVHCILQKVLGDRFIFTNPSFYTLLEENDGILVLGDMIQCSDVQSPERGGHQQDLDFTMDKLIDSFQTTKQPIIKTTKITSNIKNFQKLQSVKSMAKPDQRIDLKDMLIKELKKKYDGSSVFYQQFNQLI